MFTHSPIRYPSSDNISQAVCHRQHWATIFASRGAFQRLSADLQGEPAATTYNPTEALTCVWNHVRCPQTAEVTIEGNRILLVDATHLAYNSINRTQALRALAQNDPTAVQAYLGPIDQLDLPRGLEHHVNGNANPATILLHPCPERHVCQVQNS